MEPIENLQQRISDTFLGLKFTGVPSELYDPIAYTISLGGKRLRPTLVLATCDLCEGDLSEAIYPAIAIELFHNFTLLHDDLMDQAPLRRGKETIYKKWNANIAILSGDALFAMANRYMLKTNSPELAGIMDLFNTTAIEVCEGQQLDMNFENREDVSIAEYIEMIRLKTAVLLAASLKTGAMVAGAASSVSQKLYDFGEQVGIAFQLMDDLLDVYGSEEKFGKISGGDIVACKKTFLYLKALELSGSGRDQLTSIYLAKESDPTEKVKAVKLIFDALHIRTITLEQVDLYWNKAVEIMESTGLSNDQTACILSYCSGLMKRDY